MRNKARTPPPLPAVLFVCSCYRHRTVAVETQARVRMQMQRRALGSPVVPEVYMMVQKSSGAGGDGGLGAACPAAVKSVKDATTMPSAFMACARAGDGTWSL